jgi:putative hydrolase of the HAD superfamily
VPLKAVAFDVDGTLYPNASMYLRSVGLALFNLPLLKSLERVRRVLRNHPDLSEELHLVQAKLVARDLNLSPDEAQALIEKRVYTGWYRIFNKLKPFPGLIETIGAIRGAGLKTAVLSDFPIRGRLEGLGLAGPWDCAFSSEDTGYLKPNPQSFRLLAEKLALSVSEILYVGNSYTYDVLGAASAGMPCAHLTSRPRPGSQAVFSFSRYSQLREFVFRCLDDPEYDAKTGRVPC